MLDLLVLDLLLAVPASVVVVLLMQGLGYRVGSGEDGFVLREGCGQGLEGLGRSLGLGFSDHLPNRSLH